MIFPCDKCGICCRHLNLIPQLKQLDSGNGRCIHLTAHNLCAIYDNRPDICNVNKMYEMVYCKYMSEDEYLNLNLEGCKELKERFG